MQPLLQVLEDPGTWLLSFNQIQLFLHCSEREEEHDLRGRGADGKVWVHTWILQHLAVSGCFLPGQEPAESEQKALTMPGTNSQGAAGAKTGILGAQTLPEFRGRGESARAAGSDWKLQSCRRVPACPQLGSPAPGLALSGSIPKSSHSKGLPAVSQHSPGQSSLQPQGWVRCRLQAGAALPAPACERPWLCQVRHCPCPHRWQSIPLLHCVPASLAPQFRHFSFYPEWAFQTVLLQCSNRPFKKTDLGDYINSEIIEIHHGYGLGPTFWKKVIENKFSVMSVHRLEEFFLNSLFIFQKIWSLYNFPCFNI